jgi:hypothetical protein
MSNWRNIVAMDSPQEKTQTITTMTDVLKPKPMLPPVEEMNRSFNDFDSYKRDFQPNASGVDF